MQRNKFIIAIVFLLGGLSAQGTVRLPRLISDGMVLQRDAAITVWGWADPDEKITLRFAGHTYTSAGDNEGKWKLLISPMKAGGPYSLDITGVNHVVINDILIGDVWLCSGQSNMALTMDRVKERYASVIAHSQNNMIRHFFVPTQYDFKKKADDVPDGKWESADPRKVLNFSAVAYFFAMENYQKYHVPIGLINASVGGSPVEAWLSPEGLRKFPSYESVSRKFAGDHFMDSIRATENRMNKDWYEQLNGKDPGLREHWYRPDPVQTSWPELNLPGEWSSDKPGSTWLRKDFTVSAAMTGSEARLLLGCIVDRDSAFVNGTFVGATSYKYPPRRYTIPAGVLKAGLNTLTVRAIATTGQGGFVKDKPYQLNVGSDSIDLRGMWHFHAGAAIDPIQPTTFFQYKPGGLFNGMIAPLLNCHIKGAIWYQGESNTSRANEYAELFKSMITDWRTNWAEGDFPFLFVQLANFQNTVDGPAESQWAELREAQRQVSGFKNCGMAVAIDLGEWNDIHPLNKSAVSHRLFLVEEALVKKDKGQVFSGPTPVEANREGGKIIVSFIQLGSGMIAKGGLPLNYFEIAGPDRKFFKATAEINNNRVQLICNAVPDPLYVRYAWADNPATANLYNRENLPATPFELKIR